MNIFDQELNVMTRMMNVANERHGVIAANIANTNTPGYTAKKLRFEDTFREVWNRSGRDAAMKVDVEVVDSEAPRNASGNNVQFESELTLMQKNQLAFNLYNAMLKHKLTHLKLAVNANR